MSAPEFDLPDDGIGDAESFERDLAQLVCICREKLPLHNDPFTSIGAIQNWIKRVQDAANEMQVWLDESDRDDPRANGWVGKDGRP